MANMDNTRWSISLCSIVALAAACTTGPVADDARPVPAPGKADGQTSGLPMISEYAEATFGHNKAIELFNPLPFAVSMDDCSVRVFSNGRETTNRVIGLQGVVMPPNGTAVVCNSQATEIDGCDVSSGSLSYNGNDAITLACDFGSGPRTLDVVGIVGDNPGSQGWSAGDASTRNQTLRRACTQPAGDDVFDGAQWVAAGADVFDGFGEHTLCDGPVEPACSQGPEVIGSSSVALLAGEDERFDVLETHVLFDNFTAQAQNLLLQAASQFLLEADQLTDAASALAGVAREGSGRVEFFTIHDTTSGVDFDAVRYYANDATSHSAVAVHGTPERVALSFDGEFFGCDPIFCEDGELSRVFYEQLDENDEPVDRFEIVDHQTILGVFNGRFGVLRSDDAPTLLSAAWEAHGGTPGTSSEVLEQLARQNAGPITYHFIAGPTEDLEGVTFVSDDGTRGMLAVEDSVDPELLTADGTVTSCAAPPQ